MAKIVLFNKPFGVHSQFSGDDPATTLAAFIEESDVYPAGRLDRDSEGLLVLTDNGPLQHLISHPRHDKIKRYLVQVEGTIDQTAIARLESGVKLKDGPTKPAEARIIGEPELWEREPPIRTRASIPTSWLELAISEGRNRQVRRMTAAVGYPTLRLVRTSVGEWELGELLPGEAKIMEVPSPSPSPSASAHPHRSRGSRSTPSGRRSPASSKRGRGF